MRFHSLHLIRYGHFTDRLLELPTPDNGKPDIHIVYGRNEAGKSTLSNAIMDFLYEIPARSRYAFMHDYPSLEIAATIHNGKGETDTELKNKDQSAESVTLHRMKSQLRDINGKAVDSAVLDKHNLSRQDYESRFWVDDTTLHKGGESILSSKGELGAALFAATTGLNTLTDQLNQLMLPTDAFFKPGKRTKILVKELKDSLKDVQKELKSLDTNRTQWNRLQKLLKQQTYSVSSTRAELKTQRDLKSKMLSLKGSLQKFQQWRINQIKLNETQHLADIPEHWYDDVQKIRPEYHALTKNIQLLKSEITSTNLQLSKHTDLDNWATHQHELEQLKLSSELFSSEQKKIVISSQELQVLANESIAIENELKLLPVKTVNTSNLITDTTQQLIDEKIETWKTLTAKKEHLEQERTRTSEKLEQLKPVKPSSSATVQGSGSPNRHELDKLIRTLEAGEVSDLLSSYKQNRQLLSEREQEALELKLRVTSVGIDHLTDLHELIAPSATAIRESVEKRRTALATAELARENVSSLDVAIDDADRQLNRLGHTVTDKSTSYQIANDKLRDAWNTHKSLIEGRAKFDVIKTQTIEVERRLDALDSSINQQLVIAENFGKIQSILESKQDYLNKLDQARKNLVKTEQALNSLITAQNQTIAHLPNLTFDDSPELINWREALDAWRVVDRKRVSQQSVVDQLQQSCLTQNEQLNHRINQLAPQPLPDTDSTNDAVQGMAGVSLAETLAHARETVKLAEQLWQDTHQANTRKQEINDELQRLDRESEHNNNAINSLNTEIDKAVIGSWLESVPTSDIVSHWQAIKRHKQCLDQQSRTENEINLAQANVDDVTARLLELAVSVKIETSDNTANNYQQLMDFHDLQQHAHTTQSELKKRTDQLNKKLEQHNIELNSIEQLLNPMHERLGTTKLDELQSALLNSHQCFQLMKTQAQIETDICELRSVDTFKQAMNELESFIVKPNTTNNGDNDDKVNSDADNDANNSTANAALIDSTFNLDVQAVGTVLEQKLNELEIIESNLESTLEREQNSSYDTQQQLNQMGSDERVAVLRQKEADLIHEIEEGVTDALKMRLGLRAIERGLQHFRDKNRSGMLAKAKTSFITLTENSYVDLVTRPNEKGVEQLIATRNTGASVSADNLSVGTRYQLYLALRIAAYHEYRKHRTPLPFIADDIFETFDEPRTRSALTEFSQMAQHGQVIYFTHHRHVADIAREVVPGINTIELN